MQALRNASFLARLVLAWFALAVGVAVASPVVKPQGIELLCSGGGGMKLLVTGEDGSGPAAGGHTLDCPLCASLDAPPDSAENPPQAQRPSMGVLLSLADVRAAALVAARPPARGPPLVFA